MLLLLEDDDEGSSEEEACVEKDDTEDDVFEEAVDNEGLLCEWIMFLLVLVVVTIEGLVVVAEKAAKDRRARDVTEAVACRVSSSVWTVAEEGTTKVIAMDWLLLLVGLLWIGGFLLAACFCWSVWIYGRCFSFCIWV